ncbi:MAG: hypothetical protein ACOC3G_00230, partial [Phycisphaeraceae bacterium]
AVAFLLRGAVRGRGLLRTVYFLPYVTSTVAAAMVWRVLFRHPGGVANTLLERLGGGVLAGDQRINFSTARMERTSNPLDAALFRDGRFFAVRAGGENGEQSVRLTRDGRFQVNADGRLTLPSGHLALNPDDEPITVNPSAGPARIEADGSITQNGLTVGRLQISRVEDLDSLRKTRGGLYEMTAGDVRLNEPTPELRPGFVEASGVDPFKAMMDVTAASKAAMSNADMIRYQGRVMDLAANTLGKVTG